MYRSSELSGKSSELSGKSILMDANLSGKVMVDTCSAVAYIWLKVVCYPVDDVLVESCSIHCRILQVQV